MLGAIMSDDFLEGAFTQYLQANLDPYAGKEFSQALRREGLVDEGLALQTYLNSGEVSACVFQRQPWAHRQCLVSPTPPVNARFGDLWLDTVEMNMSVFVPNKPGTSPHGLGWISTHPVCVWQFLTFLKLVRRGRVRTEFPFPADYLSLERFKGLSSASYVTDVYQDEAFAYSRWFGKWLSSQLDLANARHHLQPQELEAVLPAKMYLWDSSEDIEGLRLAISHDNMEKQPGDEVQLSLRGQGPSHSDRMVYGEWERSPFVGLSTVVLSALAIDRRKKSHTAYFDLENTALNLSGMET
jgi:hypothetical protein